MEKPVEHPVSRRLHPVVNLAIIGLALLYILSVWIGFAGSEYTDYLLVIASLFVLGALALPLVALSVWRANRRPDSSRSYTETFRHWVRTFRDWRRGDVDIAPGRVSGTTATIEALLPIAAVAFGMTAFAIVALMNG